jgi:hypothetical protein
MALQEPGSLTFTHRIPKSPQEEPNMSFVNRHARVLVVAVSCLGVGAGASAIASAGAGTTPTASAARPAKLAAHRGWQRELRRTVHGEFVIHTKKGFQTVTFDRGVVGSVAGDVLTLREGTKTASYKTATLTIAADARVRNNRQRATLSSVKPGERAVVIQGPARTLVLARAAK